MFAGEDGGGAPVCERAVAANMNTIGTKKRLHSLVRIERADLSQGLGRSHWPDA